MISPRKRLDSPALSQRLQELHAQNFWRSLDELAQDEEFRALVEREFAQAPGTWDNPMSRRRFLALMGASLSLSGLVGCSTSLPPQPIVPYVRAPERVVPGRPLYFATAMPQAGYALGVLVESHEGRPTKIEGNPLHPACPRPIDFPAQSLFGPTNAFAQASILTLYDPDRSQSVANRGNISTWDAFVAALRAALASLRDGAGLRILTQTVTSPTLADQLRMLQRQFPAARWHVYEPVGRDNVLLGTRLAFGADLEPHYRLDQADVLLSLDADFLSCGPDHVRNQQEFASRRRVRQDGSRPMNRLYMVEASCTTTGAAADHRLPVRPSQVDAVAALLLLGLTPACDI